MSLHLHSQVNNGSAAHFAEVPTPTPEGARCHSRRSTADHDVYIVCRRSSCRGICRKSSRLASSIYFVSGAVAML